MKKLLLLITVCLISCKQDKYELDESVVDSSVVAIDSSVVSNEEFVVDSSATEYIQELPVRELTYQEAIESTSIYDLKDFIKKNPNNINIEKLKERLIDLEVDAILIDERTGKMPTSDKIGESNSNISEVSIKNDTSCQLEVRYSGRESKMISIPAHQSSSISLKSGNYRVAASACGSNYAGNENLSGNYSSSYYIVTSYR
jgi:hypothetical protein